MNRARRLLTLFWVAGALAMAAPLAAQPQHPNLYRGASPAAEHYGPDSVNLQNGMLSIAIPIGRRYFGDGGISFQLVLRYASQVWDFQLEPYDPPPAGGEIEYRVRAEPNPTDNAGLGWRLDGLAELRAPCAEVSAAPWTFIVDGAAHVFYDTLHEGETPASGFMFTRDSSYLRLSGISGGCSGVATVETPDGLRYEFEYAGAVGQRQHRLKRIRDRFDNRIEVDYSMADHWIVREGHGELSTPANVSREHQIWFTTLQGRRVVDKVLLAGFGDDFDGPTVEYDFQYHEDQAFPRSCKHTSVNVGSTVNVVLLDRLVLPDDSAYDFDAPNGYNDTCAGGVQDLPGTLQAMTTPHFGRVEWTYQEYAFSDTEFPDIQICGPPGDPITVVPQNAYLGRTAGVATRTLVDADGSGCEGPTGAACTWTYAPAIVTQHVKRKTTVTYPTGDQTVFYFSEDNDQEDGSVWSGWQFGLPIGDPLSGTDLFLSQQVYDGTVASGELVRSVYLAFEHDKLPPIEASGCDPDGHNTQAWLDSNRRLVASRTVYHDDGDRFVESRGSRFDGLGHYRTTVRSASTNFPGQSTRTSSVEHNPGRGCYKVLPNNTVTTDCGTSFSMFPNGNPWLVELFDQTVVQEGGTQAKQLFCFESATGFLTKQRIVTQGNGTPGNDDILIERVKHVHSGGAASGNVGAEKLYGGDGVGTYSGADICSTTFSVGPTYQLVHEYQHGSLSRTYHPSPQLNLVDRTIDRASGLPEAERDAAGYEVTLEYDAFDRLDLVTAATHAGLAGGTTDYVYTKATASSRADLTVLEKDGSTEMSASRVVLDSFGRAAEEQRRLPGGAWTKRLLAHNARGWPTSVSTWSTGTPSSGTSFTGHDAFGRPATVQPPDGASHSVTFVYSGDRVVERTVKVDTGGAGLANSTTREIYDNHGRLYRLIEPSGASGADIRTTYGYDVGNRLASVSHETTAESVLQTRAFLYDQRGFLRWERHPEKGPTGNGYVHYCQYDAAGNPRSRVDGNADNSVGSQCTPEGSAVKTKMSYDGAGRLRFVRDASDGLLLELVYGTSNPGNDLSRGKLVASTRRNLLPAPEGTLTVDVTEEYDYAARHGRMSERRTQIHSPGGFDWSFAQTFAYDTRGETTSIGYPSCTSFPCGAQSQADVPMTVTSSFTRGYQTGVAGYASSLTYHPNHLLERVVHGNGLTDWVDADSSGIPRPSRLRTRNASADIWSTGTFAYDGAGNVTAMGSDAFEYDLVSRLTSAAMTTSQLGTGTPTRTQAPTYDAMGNIQSIATDGLGLATTTAGTTNRLTTQGAQYDSAGNMTVWSSAAYTYDQLGAMSSLETDDPPDGFLWLYAYNAAGQRVAAAQFRPTGGHTLVTLRDEHGRVIRELRRVPPLFADGFESQDTSAWSSTEPFGLPHGAPYAPLAPLGSPEAVGMGEQWHVVKDYVYRNGGLLAAEERFPHDRLVHYHLDHLGTPRLITSATGTVLAHHKHYPFGEEATSITLDAERMKFTSHERELSDPASDEDDLDYMRARYYSFRTGRFTSPDLLLGDPWVPQSWNRYSYVFGRSMNYRDPSGLSAEGDDQKDATYYDWINVFGGPSPLDNLPPWAPPPPGSTGTRSGGGGTGGSDNQQLIEPLLPALAYARTDVQQFFACLGELSLWGQGRHSREHGGFGLLDESGELSFISFIYRQGEHDLVVLGTPPSDAVFSVHTHPTWGESGFFGADRRYVNVNKGYGNQRIPGFLIHRDTGVTRYLPGVDRAPGNLVLPAGFEKGLEDVCANASSY